MVKIWLKYAATRDVKNTAFTQHRATTRNNDPCIMMTE